MPLVTRTVASIVAALLLASSVGLAQTQSDGTTLPLKPTRTIKFTTDEGTWMSLDVSPDGRTIVFELLGDLYTMPITGGKATRITSGMGFDAQPRYSPDGKTIVFSSDRTGGDNLWVINADGSRPRALTRTEKNQYVSPVWTPDGKGIIVSKSGPSPYATTYDLYYYHVDGGSGVKLIAAGDQSAQGLSNFLGATFGGDARSIYVAVKRGGHQYNQKDFGWQLATFDRESGAFDVILQPRGGGMRPMVSPDGKNLIYATRGDTATGYRIRDLESGEERWLLEFATRDDQEARATRDLMPGGAFLNDGSAIIITNHGKIVKVDIASGKETVIPFTADIDQSLGPLSKFEYSINDSSLVVQQIRDPRVSPDGRRIVFVALDRVWIATAPAPGSPAPITDAKRLTNADIGEFSPTWSPDGQYIAFTTWGDQGGHLMRVRPDGQGLEQLTKLAAMYDSPAYTPNGTRIVAFKAAKSGRETGSGAASELVWLPAAGGPIHRIAGQGIRASSAPYFVGGDTSRVYVGGLSMRFDGTDRRNHLTVNDASWIQISPDGRLALAETGNNLFLLAVPMVGNNPTITVDPPAAGAVPVRRVTRFGGEFGGWSPDGKSFTYALGKSFFRYDLTTSEQAIADSAAKTGRQAGDSARAYDAERHDVRMTVAKDRPRATVVFRGARIITMKGDEIIENGDLLVVNNRIGAVGKRGSVKIPQGATVRDVSGKTIIPGFVDVHWHGTQDGDIHGQELWTYHATLAWGTTTTRNPQTGSSDVLTYADRVETGDMLGPRIYSTGPGLFEGNKITSLDRARDELRRYSEFYDTKTVKQYSTGERKVRQWVVMALYEQRISPTNENWIDVRKNLTQITDGYAGNEHSYGIFPLYNDFIQFHAQSGTTDTPTLVCNFGGPCGELFWFESENFHDDPKVQRFLPHSFIDAHALRRGAWYRADQYVFRQEAEQLKKIVEAGGRVGLGAHGEFQGPGTHWELWMIQSGGMKNHDALRVATIFGADAIGLAKDIGSLEPGKLADLQILDKNPLANIRNSTSIRFVMKNGRLYDANTLDEVWPRVKKRRVPTGGAGRGGRIDNPEEDVDAFPR